MNYSPTQYTQQINPPITSFAFAGNPSTIYALPFTYAKNFFSIVTLSAGSLQYTPITGTNNGGNNTTGNGLVSAGNLLYTNSGQVWDPVTQTEVGTFPVTTYNSTSYPNMRNVAVDSSLGAIYVTGSQPYGNSSSAVVLSAYGAQSLTLTGTLAFPLIGYPNVTNLVRWGADGFAFIAAGPGLTDQELYLGRSSIIAPQTVNAVPALTGLSPSSATVGSGALTLTLNGSNFLTGSTVSWNGTTLPVTYVSSTQLNVSIPASDLTQSGTAKLAVTNPAPGGGTSSAQVFTIVAAVPQLASSASSVDFGSIAQGASSSVQAITLTNTGTAALSISSIAANGDFSQTNTCGGTLPVNATCQVSIVFTPTSIGQRTGKLTVSDNATGSPQTVTLSGTGVVQALTLGVGTGGSTTTTVASGQAATYNLSLSGSPGFSGGSKGSSQPVSPAVTPSGTYALTVTAAAGNTTVSQKLTLVIQ
ncbi:MAG TPA: choice-of-anchor D domain-containing protein [Edaphobacter sp.]|nr:choice-of-anchor D domain-containing protein [Edaphobacter sp.]